MDYTYTVRKVDTANRILGVIYHSDGKPNYFKNFYTEDFSQVEADRLVEAFSPEVRLYWESLDTAPPSDVNEGDEGAGVATKTVEEARPSYDPLTHKLVQSTSYDAATETYTVSYTVVVLTDDEAVEAQVQADQEQKVKDSMSTEQTALLALKTIDPDTLTDEEVRVLASVWPTFAVGTAYAVADKVFYANTVWEVIQAHTSQADWRPGSAPSLWKTYRDPGVITAWVQPQGAHDAYPLGAKVTHNGKTWSSDVAANVWEPGVSQWTEVV